MSAGSVRWPAEEEQRQTDTSQSPPAAFISSKSLPTHRPLTAASCTQNASTRSDLLSSPLRLPAMSARTLAVCARIPVSPNVASSSRHCLRRYHRAQNPLPGSSQSFAAPPSRWLSASRTPSTPRVGSRHRGLHTSAGGSPRRAYISIPYTRSSRAAWTPDTPRTWHRVSPTSVHYTRAIDPLRRIRVHFKDSKGNLIKTVEANEGDDVLGIAHEHDIDLEGTSPPAQHAVADSEHSLSAGACEGSVACSTCHVIVSPKHYDLLPEPEVRRPSPTRVRLFIPVSHRTTRTTCSTWRSV